MARPGPRALVRGSQENEAMRFEIPDAMKSEHEDLSAELAAAMRVGGKTAAAAKAVADAARDHLRREEEFALPPLALVASLAAGGVTEEMRDVLALTERLKAEMPRMMEDHAQIVIALDRLVSAAKAERKEEVVRFADRLARHAQIQEQVTYPAAVLVGEFIKLKLGGK
jgi:hypothetical protein